MFKTDNLKITLSKDKIVTLRTIRIHEEIAGCRKKKIK